MRLVIQRVKSASVRVNRVTVGAIESGMVVFVGVGKEDTTEDAAYLVKKITELRIFEDDEGKMNRSALDVSAGFLVVSQFTLLGNCTKGRRPSFDAAADPVKGERLYNAFVEMLSCQASRVETGQFRALMEVELINDGPVTFVIDSRS